MAKEEKKIDFSALAQAFDTSFARASQKDYKNYSDPEDREPIEWRIDTRSVASGPSDFAVKARLIGDSHIQLMYITTFVYTNSQMRVALKQKWDEESNAMLKEAVKRIKKEYKEQAEESITFKETKTEVTVQDSNVNIYGGRNTAYYRRFTTYEIK
jgi:hypothetical protein